jgi:uncharacterized protein (TIGR02145 family)
VGDTAVDQDFPAHGSFDDGWGGPYPIGFAFCFLNETYTQYWIGSNGWISFTNPQGHSWTTWTPFSLPSTDPTVPKNAIFSPYQDWYPSHNPGIKNVFRHIISDPTDSKLVVYWNNCPMYNCYTGSPPPYGTFQIVIHQQNSIIENNITHKGICSWQANAATQGVHNADGTLAYIAFNRNQTDWKADEESTRFVPSGVSWYRDTYPGGPMVGQGDSVYFKPLVTTTYFAVVNTCINGEAIASRVVPVFPPVLPTITGNRSVCMNNTEKYKTEPGMTKYSWIVSGGTIVAGGASADDSVTVKWDQPFPPYTVGVNYTNLKGCRSLSPYIINITVNSFMTPVITGLNFLCPGAQVTYSTQAGYTNYQWTYPGATLISGGTATDNTLTVTWNTAGAQNISVNYTDVNGCTSNTPVWYPVTVYSLPVPTVAGPAKICAGTPGALYTTQPGMTSYLWTVSAGGTITAGGTPADNTVTVIWNAPGPETVSVNYQDPNGCTAVSAFVFPVTVNSLPVPTIAGNQNVCVGVSGTVYSTQAGMNNYFWAVSAGGTITAGGTGADNTATVTWNIPGTQTISVNYNDANTCTATTPVPFQVTVHTLPVPVISGPPVLCAGSMGAVYSTQPGMTNYQWAVSAGGNITAGGTTADNTATVTWTTPGIQDITLNFQDLNGCVALAPVSFPVTVNSLPVPSVAGPGSACLNSSSIYSTDPGMSNYTWSVTAGGNITAGLGSNTITVLWSIPGAQTITVNYSDANNCAAAPPSGYPVTVSSLPTPSLNGSNNVCKGNSILYSTDAGMSNYSWVISGGGILTTGGGLLDNTATVTWNATGAQFISVNYQVGPGCMAASPKVLVITVKPVPSVINAANSSVCSATLLNITPLADLAGTNFSWTASGSSANVSGFNSGIGVTIFDLLVNSGFTDETVTYSVLPSLSGCDGVTSDFVVTVHPVADVLFTPNGQSFCSGGKTNISLGSDVTLPIFTWSATGSSGNISGFGPGGGNAISQTLINNGFIIETATYHVIPSTSSCPGTGNDVVITVFPLPAMTFTPCTDIITTPGAQPFTLRGGTPLGGMYSGPGVNAGIFNPALAGTGSHTITYSYSNTWGCAAGATQVITVVNPGVFFCDNLVTDIRDNKQYPTIKIGAQCWMAANLNFGNTVPSSSMQRDNCVVEKYCFNDNAANCISLGGLYQWDEMMQFNALQAIQGICPPEWHVPTENEWTTLFNFYTSNGFAGSPLKFTGYSGFKALLDGVRLDNVNWDYSNFAGFFWSSTAHGPSKAWAHAMNTFNPSVSYYPGNRSHAFSVRCIKD